MTEEKILSVDDLYRLFGRGMARKSFPNWIVRAKKEGGFPSQIVLLKRSAGWRWSEVSSWLDSRPRSDSSRSPNSKAKRLTLDQRVAQARELCRKKRLSLSDGLEFLRKR